MTASTACPKCQTAIPVGAKFCPSCGTPSAKQPMVFGDYEATEVIGEGGMGRVYKAKQRRLNRVVCIKTLLPQFAEDPSVIKRFEQEAMTMAALSHPNIVQVFDVGQTPEGVAYIVMELVDGRPLRVILRDESPVPASRAIKLVDQVLAGLGEAHTHNIVHRDLKPGNVLVVSLRDGAELCKVLDFGIARVLDESEQREERLTRTGTMVGTPGYMAPEQMMGEAYDARVDLYAAGVLLYELLTGQRLFRAPNETELMKMVLLQDPAPPSTRTSQQVTKALDALVLKALARKPAERFESAAEFRDALSKVQRADEPMMAESSTRAAYDFTSLAEASTSDPPDATSNTRSLLSAVLSAADEWERSRLLEPFERSMRVALSTPDYEAVRAAVLALQQEQKEKGVTENLKALLDATRAALVDAMPGLIESSDDTRVGSQARWLLRLLGKSMVPKFLENLPGLPHGKQKVMMEVIRSIDPGLTIISSQLKTMNPDISKIVMETIRTWPGDTATPLFNSLLLSPDPSVRQMGLRALDERTAFRLGSLIRQRLHDPVSAVRQEALRWVERLEDDSAVDDLRRLLQRASIEGVERIAVWKTLSTLRSDEAVTTLMEALSIAKDIEQSTELARLLVRTRDEAALEHVRATYAKTMVPKLKRALEEVLKDAERSA